MAEKKTEIDYLQDLEKAHKKYLDLIKSQEALSKECKDLTDELRSVHREYMREPELRIAAIKETKAKYSKQVQEEYEASRKYTKAVNDSYEELKKFENVLKNNDLKKLFTHLINNVNKDMSDKIHSAIDKYKAMNAPKQSLTTVVKEVKQVSKPVEKLEKAVEKLEKTVEKVSSAESGSVKTITPKVSKTQLMREKTLNDFFNGTTDTPGISDFLADPKAARAAVVEAVRGSKKRTPETFMAEILKSFNDLSNSGAIQYKKGSTQEEVQKFVTKGFFDVSAKQEKEVSKTQRQESTVNPKQPAQPEKIDISEEQRIKVAKKAEAKAVDKVVVEKERSIDFEAKANESLNSFNSVLSNLTARSKRLTDTVNRADIILSGAVYGLTAIRKSIEKSKLVERIFGLSKVLDKTADKLSKVPKQAKVKDTLGSPMDTAMDAVEKEVPEIKRPKSSHAVQESRNRDRANQKGFIALLIPALAKLLHKTPIWDAIKLLLLKFGAKHPLMTAGALMAGPALIAGGIGLRAMGGLKGIGSVFNRNSGKAASNVLQIGDRRTRVRVGRLLQAPGNYLNGLGSRAESNISNKILDLQNNRRALLDLQASKEARIPQLAAKEAKLVKQQQYAVRELLPLTSGKKLSYKQRARKVQLQQEVQKRYGKIKNVRAEIAGVQGKAAKLDPYLDSNLKAIEDLTRAQKRLKNPMWNLAEKLKVFGSDIGSVGKGFIKSIGNFAGKVKNIKFSELLKGGFGAIKGGFLKSINPMTAFRAVGKIGKGAKVLGPIGTALTAVAEIPDLINAARSGKPGALKKQLVKSGGGVGGALVGGAIGSALGPVGTVVGAIIGDIVGRIVGPALFDGFKVFTGKLGADFKGIWDGLKQTFGSAMRIITPIARLIGRMLVPSFKLLGLVLGGLVKAIVWTVKIVAKTLGWVADKIANVVESITKGLEWLGNKLLEIPVIGPALKKLYGTSGDEEEKPTEDTNNGAMGTVDSAVSSNPRVGPIPGEDDQPQRYGGVPKNAKLYNVNGLQAVALKDLGLKGNIWSGNSKPFVGAQNGSNVQFLDGLLNKWGYGVTYTSGMGGNHAKNSGHYKGTKLDLQLTKNGRAAQLTPQQLEILKRYGYWGGDTGALGWEPVKGQSGGGHYDMYVAQGSSLRETGSVVPANGTEVATSFSNRAKQETSDGVREALLAFAGENKKDKDNQRTRNLIFQATDVTGSLGCWGITQVNNSGQMRH